MAVGVTVFTLLGFWQLDRAREQRARIAEFGHAGNAIELSQLPADAPRFQRVTARGHYDTAHQFLHDNRVHQGTPGVHVLTPLVLADGSALLVNRGWLPLEPARRHLPAVAVDEKSHTVTGLIDDFPRTPIELPARTGPGWPKLVQYPHVQGLAARLGRELYPRILLLDPWESDGYVREWRPPGAPPTRNVAYAVQWFAFAAAVVAIWFVTSRPAREHSP